MHRTLRPLKTLLPLIPLWAFPIAAHAQTTLINPLGESDVRLLIARLIQGALSLTGSIALLMFIYGGFLWLTAMGRPDQVTKGKHIFIWSILGIIVIASAYVVVNALFLAILTGSAAPASST